MAEGDPRESRIAREVHRGRFTAVNVQLRHFPFDFMRATE